MMKKLSIALAVAGAFAATSASALTLGQYDQGCLVPSAVHGGGLNTVVGITSRTATTVYWTFFDVNSNHVTDGQFAMTSLDQTAFDWASSAGAGLSGTNGYLVFSSGVANALSATDDIACNSFLISSGDAAFIPTVPLTTRDYAGGLNLTVMNNVSIVALTNGTRVVANGAAPADATGVDMRYWIDGATAGRDTSIVVWTANAANATYTVNMFDDAQTRKSVNFTLANQELNLVNPENILGRPASFVDGFINWSLTAAIASGVMTYSVVSDPSFSATQTLVNPAY